MINEQAIIDAIVLLIEHGVSVSIDIGEMNHVPVTSEDGILFLLEYLTDRKKALCRHWGVTEAVYDVWAEQDCNGYPLDQCTALTKKGQRCKNHTYSFFPENPIGFRIGVHDRCPIHQESQE